jgi:predicted metal-dependent hydrolase
MFYFKIFKKKNIGGRSKARKVKKVNLEYKNKKEDARKLVLSKLEYFNKFYNYKWGRVAIRDTRTRWGSCSSKSNLNFNYRIIDLPSHLADYLIVHELCHLAQMNHSQNFWDLVAVACPDYIHSRSQLRAVKF